MNQITAFEPMTKHGKVEPVTAVAFAPKLLPNAGDAILAIGLECGQIELWTVPLALSSESSCYILHVVDVSDCHLGVVKNIEWRPCREQQESNNAGANAQMHLTFATCGSDHGVRIFDLDLI